MSAARPSNEAEGNSACDLQNFQRVKCVLRWAEQYANLDLGSERSGDGNADALSYLGELLRNGVVLSRLTAARLQRYGDRGLRWHANGHPTGPQLGPTTRSVASSNGSHKWTAASQLPGTHSCPTTVAQARHNLELVLRELRRDRRVVDACSPHVATAVESSPGRGSVPEGKDLDLLVSARQLAAGDGDVGLLLLIALQRAWCSRTRGLSSHKSQPLGPEAKNDRRHTGQKVPCTAAASAASMQAPKPDQRTISTPVTGHANSIPRPHVHEVVQDNDPLDGQQPRRQKLKRRARSMRHRESPNPLPRGSTRARTNQAQHTTPNKAYVPPGQSRCSDLPKVAPSLCATAPASFDRDNLEQPASKPTPKANRLTSKAAPFVGPRRYLRPPPRRTHGRFSVIGGIHHPATICGAGAEARVRRSEADHKRAVASLREYKAAGAAVNCLDSAPLRTHTDAATKKCSDTPLNACEPAGPAPTTTKSIAHDPCPGTGTDSIDTGIDMSRWNRMVYFVSSVVFIFVCFHGILWVYFNHHNLWNAAQTYGLQRRTAASGAERKSVRV